MARLREFKSETSEEIKTDGNGKKYKEKKTKKWVYCGCHPETCAHFDNGWYDYIIERVYIE